MALLAGAVTHEAVRAEEGMTTPARSADAPPPLIGHGLQVGENISETYGGFGYSPSASGGSAVIPENGDTLFAKYVLFSFDPIPQADSYQLQVVIDNGEPDPFVNSPVVDVIIGWPRKVVREGFEFANNYAWRVRDLDGNGSPGEWSSTREFSIAALPPGLNSIPLNVTLVDSENYAPGLTLMPLSGTTVALDMHGNVVWFWQRNLWVVRLLRNGNILYTTGSDAGEATLQGDVVWNSGALPTDFHEVYEMPNGNILLLVEVSQQVQRGVGPQTWLAQELTEVTRSGDVVWTWNPFDHISTMDFDECSMQGPGPFGHDWIHANAAFYDARENAVYYNSRHISRVTKIDYATGEVLLNIGFEMPSGEVEFGDDLFSWQHSPEILENGNILLYDNGNRRGHSFCDPDQPYSTAVEFTMNPESPNPVEEVWRYELDVYTPFVGDADRLSNGNTLITAGAQQLILEVTPEGSTVWEYSSIGGGLIYRADRIPTLYPLRGDADVDDDIDFADFADFQRCFKGAGGTDIFHECLAHDFDNDGDVDVLDFEQFFNSSTGPGR